MNLGFWEIVAVAGIALLFFGPSRLPSLGKSVGEAIRGFKKGMEGIDESQNQKSHSTHEDTRNDRASHASTSDPSLASPSESRVQSSHNSSRNMDPAQHTNEADKTPTGSRRE
jgi:sec-independent protein translocase protein TatA